MTGHARDWHEKYPRGFYGEQAEKQRSWPGSGPCALCYIRVWHSRAECAKAP